MPEESAGSQSGGTHNDGAQERLERRLDRIEIEILRENRWWRGGLIAALVLLALSVLIVGHHRRRRDMGPMGPAGWGARMPYGQFGGGYPPPWAFHGHGGCGCEGEGAHGPGGPRPETR